MLGALAKSCRSRAWANGEDVIVLDEFLPGCEHFVAVVDGQDDSTVDQDRRHRFSSLVG